MAGMGLGEMVVRIGVDPSAFESGINRVLAKLDSLPAATARASERSSGHLRGFFGGLMNVGSQIGMLVFGVETLARGAERLGSALVEPNAQMEQWTVAMTTLLHSSAAAKNMMQTLSDFAARTPFQLDGLVSASESLLSFGFRAQDLIPDLTAIGDAISAFGGSQSQIDAVVQVFGRLQATGKLTQREIMELATNHIPALQIIAQQMGITTEQVAEKIHKGLINGNDAVKLLTTGFEKLYGGAMQKQSQTFNGLMSTLHDNIEMAWRAFTGPLFDKAKVALESLGNAVSSKGFQEFAKNAGVALGQVMSGIGTALAPVGAGLKIVFDLVRANWPTIVSFANALSGVGTDFKIVTSLGTSLSGWWQSQMQPALNQATPGFQHLAQVVGQLVLGLLPVIQAFRDLEMRVVQAAMPIIQFLLPIIVKLAGWLSDQLAKALAVVGPAFLNAAKTVMQFANDVLARLQPILAWLIPLLQSSIAEFAKFWNMIWPYMAGTLAGVWNMISGVVRIAWSLVSGIILIGLDILGGKWGKAWDDLKNMLAGVWGGIKQYISGAVQVVVNVVGGAWTLIKAGAVQGWNNITGFIKGAGAALQNVIMAPFNWCRDHIGDVLKGFANGAIGVLNGALNGFGNFLNFFVDAVDNIANALGAGKPVPHVQMPQVPYLARGTDDFRGGLAMVGEQGPELVRLPKGSQVIPNHRTLRMLGGARQLSGGGAGADRNLVTGPSTGLAGGWGLPTPPSIPGWVGQVTGAAGGALLKWGEAFLGHLAASVGDFFASGLNLKDRLRVYGNSPSIQAFADALVKGGLTGSSPAGAMWGQWMLKGLPLINQLAAVDFNRDFDCVPASLASAASYLTGHKITTDYLKNNVYGNAYHGGQSAAAYRGFFHWALGLDIGEESGGRTFLMSEIVKHVQRGHPVVITMPSNWSNPRYDFQPGVSSNAGWHAMAVAGLTPSLDLIAMNPWGGDWDIAPFRWWEDRLQGGRIYPVTKMANGGILREPVLGLGLHSNRSYLMGEAGPEAVVPLSGRSGSGQPLVIEIDGRTLARVLWPHLATELRQKAGIRTA